jgi:hypothetical protein
VGLCTAVIITAGGRYVGAETCRSCYIYITNGVSQRGYVERYIDCKNVSNCHFKMFSPFVTIWKPLLGPLNVEILV